MRSLRNLNFKILIFLNTLVLRSWAFTQNIDRNKVYHSCQGESTRFIHRPSFEQGLAKFDGEKS